jgi:GNAT superfamily N-acetyltransferase
MITSSLWRLGPSDTAAVHSLLDADRLRNVYLRSELRIGGLGSAQWWGVGEPGRVRALLMGGPLVSPFLPELEDAGRLVEALDRQQAARMIVGPREQVHALHAARRPTPPLRDRRDPQPVLALGRGDLRAKPAPQVRRGTAADLERLTLAAAAMHREEMGIDPLAVDPTGWRSRMSTLIQRGWSWVWTEGEQIVFKAELSAWTPEVAQVQGVYTTPELRNRGIGTAALAAVCRDVLEQVPVCTLYVNHFNAAARAVYRRLGFEHVGDFATLMY